MMSTVGKDDVDIRVSPLAQPSTHPPLTSGEARKTLKVEEVRVKAWMKD